MSIDHQVEDRPAGVVRFEAVDDRPSLDRDAATSLAHAFVGDDAPRRHREVEIDGVALPPDPVERTRSRRRPPPPRRRPFRRIVTLPSSLLRIDRARREPADCAPTRESAA